MKLLSELNSDQKLGLIVEGEGAEKKHYLKGLVLEFDSVNKNGRIYRSQHADQAVHNYIKEKMNDNRGWGELDHPDGPTINLKNVSHRMIELHKEGTNWYGKSIICETPMGQIAKGLLASGGTLGSSSRGLGSVKQVNEALEVQSDFRLVTPSDLVSDPSAHGALMNGIMENVDYLYDESNGSYVVAETSSELKTKIKKMSLQEIEEQKVKLFNNFLLEIAKK